MKKTALVIGGNRFFGRHLVQNLLDSNFEVTLLNRGNVDDGFNNKLSRLKVDRRDFDALDKALKNRSWDFVIDQVCFTGPEAKALGEILTGKTGRLGVTSSQSVYDVGYELGEKQFDPLKYSYTKPVTAAENYSETKRQMESEIIKFKNLNPILFRFPFVIGHDDYTRRLHWHVDRVKKKLSIYFPNPEARLGFIHSKDAGNVILRLMNTDWKGGINCASPEDIAVKDLMSLISKETKSAWLLAEANSEDNHSPYGVKSDWTMSVNQLKSLGLELPYLDEWLHDLVREISVNQGLKS